MQGREIRRAVLVKGADFGIDDRIGQLAGSFRDSWIFGSPIEALAGFQGHLAVHDAHLDAVAVELDLVNPAFG